MKLLPTRLHVLAASFLLVGGLTAAAVWKSPTAAPADGRVIILGFDGADGRTAAALLEEDPASYPAFARLKAEGTFQSLIVEAPPESPVSWAALNTGQNPAKTGVPGFVKRSINGPFVMPDLGHIAKGQASLENLDNVPIPTWSAPVMGGVAGGAVFFIALLLLLLVSRGRFFVALPIALVLAGAAGYFGHQYRGYLPDNFPRTTNPNQARNLWDFAAEGGARCVVIDAAQAFDMPVPEGAKVLAGLGVPDARGEIGDWFIYTTDPAEVDRAPKGRRTTTAGTVFRVDEYDGIINTRIFGPRNFWKLEQVEQRIKELDAALKSPTLSLDDSVKYSQELRELKDEKDELKNNPTSVDLEVQKDGNQATVTLDGNSQTLVEGEWSDFYELTFKLNPLLEVNALTRVCLMKLDEPYFQLFVNVLDVDPSKPPFWQPISQPHEFAQELAEHCGPFETYGWSTATMPFKDREISPEMLLQEVEFTLKWRENLVMDTLGRGEFELFMGVFSTTDRVQHMMYQFYDEEHPLYDAAVANRTLEFFGETIRLKDAIPKIYQQMDRVIGRVLDEELQPNDTLVICSDHGFQSFRRQVNVNNWLAENGFLAVKSGNLKGKGPALQFVDWKKTKLYSLGMGFIYVNLEGREPNGIVAQDEVDALLEDFKTKFLAGTDPENGQRFCKEVYRTADIHEGPFLSMEGDMILGFTPPYRVSWSSTSGGIHLVKNDAGAYEPGPVCTDNDSPWSGDHISMAIREVSGVFFSNRRLADPSSEVRLLQIAPTALEVLGIPRPAEMDLGPVSFATSN